MRHSLFAGLLLLSACASGTDVSTGSGLAVPESPPAGSDALPENKAWQLVWADEFDGADLDRRKWEVEESCWGGGNNERQCYVDWPETVRLDNGQLRLIAYRQTVTGPEFPQGYPTGRGGELTQKYVSGKVRTSGLADWKYGRMAARMKLPKGQGTWPAFWALPSDNQYGNWAASGEIDILEAVNLGEKCPECSGNEGENRSSGALHFGGEWPDNTYHVRFSEMPHGPGAADDFHVFAVEWGEGRIDWYVDEVMFYSLEAKDWYTSALDPEKFPNAPFDQNFYLMLNLAVGGGLPEKHNRKGFDSSSFPAELLVDWVRVYQCADDLETGRSCLRDNTGKTN